MFRGQLRPWPHVEWDHLARSAHDQIGWRGCGSPSKVIRAERMTDRYAERAAGLRAFGKDMMTLCAATDRVRAGEYQVQKGSS